MKYKIKKINNNLFLYNGYIIERFLFEREEVCWWQCEKINQTIIGNTKKELINKIDELS